MTQSSLTGVALLGTARQKALPPPPLASLQATWDELSKRDITTAVLEAAALEKVALLAGYRPVTGLKTPPACEPEDQEYAPQASIDAARRMLANEYAACLPEWLELVRSSGLLAPPRLLPALIDYASSHRSFRDQIMPLLGKRGQWLAHSTARWRWLVQKSEPLVDWEVASLAQRLAHLAALRLTDPAVAAQLITSTWDQESPDGRAAFVSLVAETPSSFDIDWLESLALKERRRATTLTACRALIQLPESAYSQRCLARAASLLEIHKRRITLTPPDDFDPGWASDGIIQKAPSGTGEKAWWARQLLARIPLSQWPAILGIKDPLTHRLDADWEEPILLAWLDSADQFPEPEQIPVLIQVLLKARLSPKAGLHIQSTLPNLLARISVDQFDLLIPKLDPGPAFSALASIRPRFDLSRHKNIARLLLRNLKKNEYLTRPVAIALAACPVPSNIPDLLKKIAALPSLHSAAEEFANTLEFRQSYLSTLTSTT
ncbi:DUF5691 domain-containing protein [Verrucomicrobiaceae bacterium 227]